MPAIDKSAEKGNRHKKQALERISKENQIRTQIESERYRLPFHMKQDIMCTVIISCFTAYMDGELIAD